MKKCKRKPHTTNKGIEKFATRKCYVCSKDFDVYSEYELKFLRFCIHCKSTNRTLKGYYL